MGEKLASKIPNTSTSFEYFVNKSDFVVETKALSMNELKDALYSLKSNKSPGYDECPDNCPEENFPQVRVRVWISFKVKTRIGG